MPREVFLAGHTVAFVRRNWYTFKVPLVLAYLNVCKVYKFTPNLPRRAGWTFDYGIIQAATEPVKVKPTNVTLARLWLLSVDCRELKRYIYYSFVSQLVIGFLLKRT